MDYPTYGEEMLQLSNEVVIPDSKFEDLDYISDFLGSQEEVRDVTKAAEWLDVFLKDNINYTLHFDIDGSLAWLESFDDQYRVEQIYTLDEL